jgi:hypothetical protein
MLSPQNNRAFYRSCELIELYSKLGSGSLLGVILSVAVFQA